MPSPVSIDSFLVNPIYNRNTGAISGYRVVCKFTDPGGIGNFYRVVIGSNDTAAISSRNYRILGDKLADGTQMSVTFRTNLHSLDTVKVQLQCIDRSTYNFYNTLNNAVGSSSISQFLAALPANPTNNISNSGLGYFAAYSVTKNSRIVP